MTSPATLQGVFAPVVTPLQADLSPDVDRWLDFCRDLLADGCHGLCPFGTTSEGNSFGVDERMEMLERLVAGGIAPEVLMPGTGTSALPDTVRLTAHAVNLGCAGVLLLPPFYYKGVSDEGIFAAVAETIERVGDERLRIYLYHIPPIAQVGFSIGLIERLVSAYPATVVGIKDSSSDWNNLHNILTNFPGFGTFSGTEKFLLQSLRLGGVGTITAMANVIPGTLRRLYDNWLSENAEALHEDAIQTRAALAPFPMIPALKAMVAAQRQDDEWRRVRPPLVALNDAKRAEALAAVGMVAGD